MIDLIKRIWDALLFFLGYSVGTKETKLEIENAILKKNETHKQNRYKIYDQINVDYDKILSDYNRVIVMPTQNINTSNTDTKK